jgi:hypothetical protein
MILREFYEQAPDGWQDLSQDNSHSKWGETRHSTLQLWEINKIRRMSEVRNYERANNLKKVRKQYQPPAQPGI